MINLLYRKQAAHLEEIYAVLRKKEITLPKSIASKIVGSRGILDKLIATKRIRMTQRNDGRFNRCDCNAADVFEYANYKNRAK